MPEIPAQNAPAIGPKHRVYYDAYQQDNGLYTIRRVPVFAKVVDGEREGFKADEIFLRGVCDIANGRAKIGHYRAWHLSHQPAYPSREEAPFLGVVDEYSVEPTTWGPVIFVDLCEVDEATVEQMELGRLPFISAEIAEGEIISVAALQSRPPHFPFPNLYVRRASRAMLAASASRQQFALQRKTSTDRGKTLREMFAVCAIGNSLKPGVGNDAKTKEFSPMPDMPNQPPTQAPPAEPQKMADAPPAAAPAAPAGPSPTDQKLDQILTLLQQLLAAEQKEKQMAEAPPNTLQPLAPASPQVQGRYAKEGQAEEFVKRAEFEAMLARQKQQAENAVNLQAVVEEVRQSGGTTEDVTTTVTFAQKYGLDAAKDYAALVRTRQPEVDDDAKEATIFQLGECRTLEDAGRTAIAEFTGEDRQEAVRQFERYRKLANAVDPKEAKNFVVFNPDPARFVRRRVEEFQCRRGGA